jgi:hypothetical protein
MYLFALAGVLLLGAQTPVDTVAVYDVVLHEIRREHPSRPVALSDRPWDGDPCTAPCAEPNPHSDRVLARLRSDGVVDAVCVVPENHLNCPTEAGKLFVALGRLRSAAPAGLETPPGGVWVRVTTIAPCGSDCQVPEIIARQYLLTRDGAGTWRIIDTKLDSVS